MSRRPLRPLPSRRQHLRRVSSAVSRSLVLVAASLALGAAGLRVTEGLAWIDAVLAASMILTGMGPIAPVHTVGGKLFLTFYALFSGLAFLGAATLLLQPLFHRFLHRFHLEIEAEES
jgi:hypothetical protein